MSLLCFANNQLNQMELELVGRVVVVLGYLYKRTLVCCTVFKQKWLSYLQDPVIGFEPGSVSWPIWSDHVDINSLFQEAV